MAKSSGLGDNFYVDGYNLSGDVGSLGSISCPAQTLEVTGIDKSAYERALGLRDGSIEFSTFFNDDLLREHVALSPLPRTDRLATYFRGTAIGGAAASLYGKQVNFDGSREDDGALTFGVTAQGNAFALEWGEQLTAGIASLSGAGSLSSLDYGAAIGTTNFGLQAYLHVFTFTGTSATVAIQSSTDNGGADAFSNVAGAVFTAATGRTFERIQTSRTQAVERYLRVNVSGTFSALTFSVMVVRNLLSWSF